MGIGSKRRFQGRVYKHGVFLHYSYYRRRLTRLQPECLLHSFEVNEEIRHLSAPSSADTAMPLAPTRGAASACKDQPPHARADTSFRAWHSFFKTVRRQCAGSSYSPASFCEQQPWPSLLVHLLILPFTALYRSRQGPGRRFGGQPRIGQV